MSKRSKLTMSLKPGRKPRHGGYTYLTRGKLPKHRKYIEAYLTAFREAAVQDLGPGEERMSAIQIVLLDRLVSLLGCVRCIEEAALEGPTKLDKNYLSFNNTIAKICSILGLERKETDEKILAPYEIAEEEKEG